MVWPSITLVLQLARLVGLRKVIKAQNSYVWPVRPYSEVLYERHEMYRQYVLYQYHP